MEIIGIVAAWLAFVALCTVVAGILSWPFARPYLDQPKASYRTDVFAVGFVFTYRAIRPAAVVFAVSLAVFLLAWAIVEAA